MRLPRLNSAISQPIPHDFRGIEVEIDQMILYVKEFSADPSVIQTARDVVMGVEPHDITGEVIAIYDWVKEHVRYVEDPAQDEALTTPKKMVEDIRAHGRISEDCDSMSTFLATLLASIGRNVRFRLGGDHSYALSHVWTQVELFGRWYDLDATGYLEPGQYYEYPHTETRSIF